MTAPLQLGGPPDKLPSLRGWLYVARVGHMARFVMALPRGASEAVRVQRQAVLDSAAVQAWHTRSAQAPLPPVPSKSDSARQQTHALQQVGLLQHA